MLKSRAQTLLSALSQGLFERDIPLRLAFLSAMAGESIFMIGPPGVAKSLIARRLKYAFADGKAFEYLMNRFSTPDEIFGPVSIQGLKNDQYHRQTEHYLPGATVVFLDEIWKAGPSIQNTLLTVINEKVFRNGAQEEKIKMQALIAASNELPAKGEGLEALWDRFLVRCEVNGIADQTSFNSMITATGGVMEDPVGQQGKINLEQLKLGREQIKRVQVPDEVLNVIHLFRIKIQEYNKKKSDSPIYVSDRRWKKIIRLLRTSAGLNDRLTVDLMDLFLVPHCVWEQPDQYQELEQIMTDLVRKHGYSMGLDLSGIKRAIRGLEKEVDEVIYVKAPSGRSRSQFKIIHKAPPKLMVQAWDKKAATIIKKIEEKINSVNDYVNNDLSRSQDNLFISEDKFQIVTENLKTTLKSVNNLSVEVDKLIHKYSNVQDGKVETPNTM